MKPKNKVSSQNTKLHWCELSRRASSRFSFWRSPFPSPSTWGNRCKLKVASNKTKLNKRQVYKRRFTVMTWLRFFCTIDFSNCLLRFYGVSIQLSLYHSVSLVSIRLPNMISKAWNVSSVHGHILSYLCCYLNTKVILVWTVGVYSTNKPTWAWSRLVKKHWPVTRAMTIIQSLSVTARAMKAWGILTEEVLFWG